MKKKEKLIIKPKYKTKMDKEELKMHLHVQRKGGNVHRDKSKYRRKPKHPKRDKYL